MCTIDLDPIYSTGLPHRWHLTCRCRVVISSVYKKISFQCPRDLHACIHHACSSSRQWRICCNNRHACTSSYFPVFYPPFYVLQETKGGFASSPQRSTGVVSVYRESIKCFPEHVERAPAQGWCNHRWLLCVSYSASPWKNPRRWMSTNCLKPFSSVLLTSEAFKRVKRPICIWVQWTSVKFDNVSVMISNREKPLHNMNLFIRYIWYNTK